LPALPPSPLPTLPLFLLPELLLFPSPKQLLRLASTKPILPLLPPAASFSLRLLLSIIFLKATCALPPLAPSLTSSFSQCPATKALFFFLQSIKTLFELF
jgi:hypothetical protein